MDIANIAAGTLIDGRYRVTRPLGNGGMSVVYQAHDEQLSRDVALKLFRPATVERDDERRRHAEVKILATLEHPTLVTLFDARLDADPAYLTTEFVGGEDLGARLRSGALPADDLIPLTASLADALAFMHQAGVVHRDVKPANILLLHEPPPSAPFAKLADFGISRLVDGSRSTVAGSVLGTAAYLSPEQASGRAAGPPSDIYSLGLVLIECVSGAMAFPGSAAESAVARLSRRPDIPADLPRDWRTLLTGMTERDPADRPTAAELFRSTATLNTPGLTVPEAGASDGDDASDAKTLLLPSASSLLPSASSTDAVRPHHRRRVVAITVAALAALIVVIVVITVIWSLPHSSVGPVVASPYPSVSGGLGQHLAQLQRSVTP